MSKKTFLRIRVGCAVLGLVASYIAVPPASGQDSTSQSLTLRDAVRIALDKNPQHKLALADNKAASDDVRLARSNLLPHVTFSETATRGNDPVYVFGSRLRQQRFGSADFALNLLNTPPPLGNFSTRFGGTWNLFDSLASWRGLSRAHLAQDAANQQLNLADEQIVFGVISSYYDLLLARKKIEAAESSLETVKAIEEQARNRFESGLSVQSDSLSAQVRTALRQQELVGSRNQHALAISRLATAMGLPPDLAIEPAEDLTERSLPEVSLQAAEQQAVEQRPDLKQIAIQEEAQRENVSMAKSSFGPRVNGFADWEADNPAPFGGGGNNWLAGLEVQIDIFQGGAKRAELSRQQAVQERVAALKESALAAARMEVRQAYYEMDSAKQQIEVARAAVAQSHESLRIQRDRYESGLLTIADLLSAEESENHSQTDYWEAVYRYYTSYARLELASGSLGIQSKVVAP